MRRTPYSPFVLKAMAPLPWKVARDVAGAIGVLEVRRGALEYPSVFVGYQLTRTLRAGQSASGGYPQGCGRRGRGS